MWEVVVVSLAFVVISAFVVIGIRLRAKFLLQYPTLKRFYDSMLLGFGTLALAKGIFTITLLFKGFLKSSYNLLVQIGMITSVTGGIILLFGWMLLLKGITSKYKFKPIIKSEREDTLKLSSGLYICPDECFNLFSRLLVGRVGIVISRTPPNTLKELLNLSEEHIFWLTKINGKNTIHPHRLEYLLQSLVDFMRSTDLPKVILIEGVEYLTIENEFPSVFKFLTSLKDYAQIHNTIILVPVDTEFFSEKELSMLKREFPIPTE